MTVTDSTETSVVDRPDPEEPTPAPAPRRRRLRPHLRPVDIALIPLLVGVLIRVRLWNLARPVWLDEQFIAINLRDHPLAGQLFFNQSAPLGWLYTNRAVTAVFGLSERSLHLTALLFGLGTLVVTYLIARRWLGAIGGFVLVSLIAVAPLLIRYSAELKQYSAEGFWVVTLVGAAGLALDRRRSTGFWITAAVAGWFSMAAIFVAPALGLVLFISTVRRTAWVPAIKAHLAALVWLVAVGAHYLLSLRFALGDPSLIAYWKGVGFPAARDPQTAAMWVFNRPAALTKDAMVFDPSLAFPLWTLAAIGVVVAALRRGAYGALLAAPVVMGFGLAVAQVVPLSERLALWMVPVLFLAIAVAVTGIVAKVVSWWRDPTAPRRDLAVAATVGATVVAAAITVVLWPTVASARREPPYLDYLDDRSAVRYMLAQYRPGDLILVASPSATAYDWYAPKGLAVRAVSAAREGTAGCDKNTLAAETQGYQRVLMYQGHYAMPPMHGVVVQAGLTAQGATVESAKRFGFSKRYAEIGVVRIFNLDSGPKVSSDPEALETFPCLHFSAVDRKT